MLEDVKLWTWYLVVNKCVVNIWCGITCVLTYELYNNLIGVHLEKNIYARSVKMKVLGLKLGTWGVKL